jgi:hypothetical protein
MDKPRDFGGHPLAEVWRDGDLCIDVATDLPNIILWYDGHPMPPGHAMHVSWAKELRDALSRAIEIIEERGP